MTALRPALLAACAIAAMSACSNSGSPSSASAVNALLPPAAAPAVARPNATRVLYIADIDGQPPGVGQIHVYPAAMKSAQQIRTITNGTGRPFGLWVDAKNILYAANLANKYPSSIAEFKPGAASPFFQINDFKGYPESVAVDAQQNVYVNESYQDEGFVQVYAPGSNTPVRTIDTGIGGYAFTPGSMAFDPQGNLLIAEQAHLILHVVKLAPGASKVVPVNLDLGNNINGPGMGIDHAGNIYVASGTGASVSVFAPGHSEPSRTISPVGAYGLTWVTPEGAIYQASGEGSLTEIARGANSPTYTLSCQCSAQGAAVSH